MSTITASNDLREEDRLQSRPACEFLAIYEIFTICRNTAGEAIDDASKEENWLRIDPNGFSDVWKRARAAGAFGRASPVLEAP